MQTALPASGFHVKHREQYDGAIDTLLAASAELGVSISRSQAQSLLSYLRCVVASTPNLTSVKDPDRALLIHLVDSLVPVRELGTAPPGRMLDLGSGGGFPGVPLAVATGRDTTLVDSIGKKMSAVQSCLQRAGIRNVETVAARSEALARSGERYSAVVVRAVGQMSEVVELATPLLGPEGVIVVMKGRLSPEEEHRASRTAVVCGVELESARTLLLPGIHETRTIVTYRRRSDPQVALPRREGMARKRPLG